MIALLLTLGLAASAGAPANATAPPPATQPATTQPAAPAADRSAAAQSPADEYCYIPPALADSVLLYHSFSAGAAEAEIDRLGGRLTAPDASLAAGLTGRGCRPAGGSASLRVHQLARPLTRPITVGLWWRLEEPMKPESGFHLVSLHANGYISNFVRGRGQWCALTEPTFVIQLYNFPGISNVNGIAFGNGWAEPGVWHHVALTVSAGSKVCVYWDGRLRSELTVKGRLFAGGDLIQSIDLGPTWLAHPMTVDELLVLDRALSGEEVADYVTAVRKLAERRFPFRAR